MVQTTYLAIPSLTPGCELVLRKDTFGVSGTEKSLYIQAALHANEVPGLLFLQHLRVRLDELEQEGRMLGQVTVLSWANPVGMAQQLMGYVLGRFDLNGSGNFDRHFPDIRQSLYLSLADCPAAGLSKSALKALMRSHLIQDVHLDTPVGALKRVLLAEAFRHDMAIDLHCDKTALLHVYSSWEHAPRASRLSRCMKVPVLLLEEEAGGGTFDQAFSQAWRHVRKQTSHSNLDSGFAAVVELRGQRDVDDDLVSRDVDGLVNFLEEEGIAQVDSHSILDYSLSVYSLDAVSHLATETAGILLWKVQPGEQISAGQVVAEIVDCEDVARRSALVSDIDGVLVARAFIPLVFSGQNVAMVAGRQPLIHRKQGQLLHD